MLAPEHRLIGILRGINPNESIAVADILLQAGIRALEIPLNSPNPLNSIAQIHARFGDQLWLGAGTVTEVAQINGVKSAGAEFIVSPNTDPKVIQAALDADLVPIPGFMTPSEAFAAIEAGASQLKYFPAATLGTAHIQALCAVLPAEIEILAVGGVDPSNLRQWLAAGCTGVALGSCLFKPGLSRDQIQLNAQAAVAAWASGVQDAS